MPESLYLDTSVISAYYDDRKPERQGLTKEFWEKLKDYKVFIPEVTLAEIRDIRFEERKLKLEDLVTGFQVFLITPGCEVLAEKYVNQKVIPKKQRNDALHLAIATINKVDALVSWNFKHLVNRRTRQLTNLINVKEGYKTIEIIAPPEV